MLKQRIQDDLKNSLLTGAKDRATVLRGLKSVILYAEVAQGIRDKGLSDEEIVLLCAKEAKKRQESADLYAKGGNSERAQAELNEKRIIEEYLPKQLSDEKLLVIIDAAIAAVGTDGQIMGKVIAEVKQKTAGQAEGGRIAQLVKERLSK